MCAMFCEQNLESTSDGRIIIVSYDKRIHRFHLQNETTVQIKRSMSVVGRLHFFLLIINWCERATEVELVEQGNKPVLLINHIFKTRQ